MFVFNLITLPGIKGFAWSSCSSVAWALLLALLQLVVIPLALTIASGDFEDGIGTEWTLTPALSSNGISIISHWL